MNGNIRIGSLFGIPFFINPSWFVVLALVTLSYSGRLAFLFPGLDVFAWVLGFITALLLFGSVLAHELGHSLVAMRQGIEVKSITLFLFGGLASLEEESKTPGDAFKVAIAGPLVSLGIFALLLAVQIFTPIAGPIAAMVSLLAYINLVLALFNLIPGLPLDGGNVLKAIVWKITGKPYKGVAFASTVGQVFGWIGVLLGIASILGLTEFGSIWTLLIGWFLLQNAGRSAQSAAIQEQLSGLTASDAVYAESPVVSADLSLREFANTYIIGSKVNWRKFLVVDADGQLIGDIEVDAMKTIPTNDWWDVPVRDLTKPIEKVQKIPATESLLDVMPLIQAEDPGVLTVVKDDGSVVGLIEKDSIFEMMQRRSQESAPTPAETTAS
ncbi:MAG: site-2 protease family protein [Synechococcales cyanobacterium T60_A2020_003]|nr:site-2 protease family protein [Synechococcales cyanobacterium T60_A2020_003]